MSFVDVIIIYILLVLTLTIGFTNLTNAFFSLVPRRPNDDNNDPDISAIS